MISHFKFALRGLLRTPGFSTVAILTLALGIGISTSSFSTANAFLFRSLPYPEADSLVRIFRTNGQADQMNFAPAVVLQMGDGMRTLTDIVPYFYDQTSFSINGEPPELVPSICAGWNLFDALRVHPVLGRGFTKEEGVSGANKSIVLTDRCWKRRFGGDPDIIDRAVRLNGETVTVVGVLPPTWHAPLIWADAEFVRPWGVYHGFRTLHDDAWLTCVARLREGVTMGQVQAEVDALATSLAKDFPREHGGSGMRVVGFAASNMGGINIVLILLVTGLATAVLLVACANLASLQLARAFGRSRELAIRSSLGANRWQLMVPQVSESLLLALGGGVLGLVFTSWINSIMGSALNIVGDEGMPIPMDLHVVLFAAGISLVSGLVFGLIPAWLASRSPSAAALKEGARGSTNGPTHNRIRFALVVGEIALSLILVASAGGFAYATRTLLDKELGWTPEGMFFTAINRPYSRYDDDAKRRAADTSLMEKLKAVPGADTVALCSELPLYNYFYSAKVLLESQGEADLAQAPETDLISVSPSYFSLVQQPLRAGRLWDESLSENGPPIAVINESFARRFWSIEEAVGKRIRLGADATLVEIIGVVGDTAPAVSLGQPTRPFQCYRPLVRYPSNYLFIGIRGRAPATSYTTAVRSIVHSLDPDLPLINPSTVPEFVRRNLSNLDVLVYNLAAYALMGLLISSIGIYGVISHVTAQRTRDIGVRMALGAQQAQILRMVLLQGVRVLVIGLAVGAFGSFVLTRVLASAMSGFGFPGLWMQVLSVLLMSSVTVVACYLPARRAARMDPVEALRAE